jgi:3-dehydroquinate synthase
MHGAALVSHYLGLCSGETVAALTALLELFGLPLKAQRCRPEELLGYLARDKKALDGAVNWVLLTAIGQTTITDAVPPDVVRRVLAEIT